MAVFTAEDPNDREAFGAHMAKVRSSADVTLRAVIRDGRLVGSIGSFVMDGDTEVTYWIGRAVSGSTCCQLSPCPGLRNGSGPASVCSRRRRNVGSLRVLRRAGFTIIGAEISYANARSTEIEERSLRLG